MSRCLPETIEGIRTGLTRPRGGRGLAALNGRGEGPALQPSLPRSLGLPRFLPQDLLSAPLRRGEAAPCAKIVSFLNGRAVRWGVRHRRGVRGPWAESSDDKARRRQR